MWACPKRRLNAPPPPLCALRPLSHASPGCPSRSITKMKMLLRILRRCLVRVPVGTRVLRRGLRRCLQTEKQPFTEHDPLLHPGLVGKEKTNKHKEFWRDTPWCASRLSRHTSHLSRDMSRLSRGHSVPFSIDLHINQAQMSHVYLGRPEFVPGTPPGHPTAKFLYVIFLYRFFPLRKKRARAVRGKRRRR